MDRIRKLLHAALSPPPPWNLLICIGSLLFAAAVFDFGAASSPVAYAAYLLSAYGLYLFIACLVLPAWRTLRVRIRKNPHIDRYYSDAAFRARVTLYCGAVVNACYAVFKLASGIWFRSDWIIAIAIYYIVLCAVKYVLIKSDIRSRRAEGSAASLRREWRSCRTAGALMLLLGIALSGIIIQILRDGQSYSYPGYFIFAMAFYAFYRITITVLRLVRQRGKRDPIILAAKSIDFAVAVVALFTLQTAMLMTFGSEDSNMISAFNMFTGIAASAAVLGIAAFTICNSQKHIKNPDTDH